MKVRKYALLLMMLLTLCFGTTSYCQDLDTINQGQQTGESSPSSDDESYNNVADALRGYNALDDESMEKASKLASPVTKIIGVLTGVINLCTFAAIFLVTALDLAYIAVPFTRDWLNPSGVQQGAQGGVQGGYGSFGAQQGAQQGSQSTGKKYVSDEAVQALMMANPQGQQGGAPGGMPGMGMGGFGMGAMQQQSQMPSGGKSVIFTYFKKRTFFMILFAVTVTILMSSLLFDCGLNLAELVYKIISLFSDGISNVQM